MNVLITSASRKVWLVRAFQDALADGGRVVAADLTMCAPALHVADTAVLLPRSDDDEFLDRLRGVSESQRIRLIVPTRDGELPLLASARDAFSERGVHVAVSDPLAVETCLDKREFLRFCLANGFDVPPVVDTPTAADLPLFARPRRGQAGAETGVVRSEDEMRYRTDHVVHQDWRRHRSTL